MPSDFCDRSRTGQLCKKGVLIQAQAQAQTQAQPNQSAQQAQIQNPQRQPSPQPRPQQVPQQKQPQRQTPPPQQQHSQQQPPASAAQQQPPRLVQVRRSSEWYMLMLLVFLCEPINPKRCRSSDTRPRHNNSSRSGIAHFSSSSACFTPCAGKFQVLFVLCHPSIQR